MVVEYELVNLEIRENSEDIDIISCRDVNIPLVSCLPDDSTAALLLVDFRAVLLGIWSMLGDMLRQRPIVLGFCFETPIRASLLEYI